MITKSNRSQNIRKMYNCFESECKLGQRSFKFGWLTEKNSDLCQLWKCIALSGITKIRVERHNPWTAYLSRWLHFGGVLFA